MAVESYEKATALIIILNQVLMLRNFIDPRENRCKYICSWVCIVSLVTLCLASLLIGHICFFRLVSLNIQMLMYAFVTLVIMYGYVIIVFVSLYNSKEASKLAVQINDVDETLKKLGVKIEYRNLLRRLIMIVSIWTLNSVAILMLAVFMWIRNHIHFAQFFVNIFYVYIMYSGSIVLLEFSIIVHWLGLKFEQTNELLATLLLEDCQTTARDRNSRIIIQPITNFRARAQLCRGLFGKVHALDQIRLVHLRLCSVSKMLNRMFEKQISIFTFMALNYMIVMFFNLYLKINKWDQLNVAIGELLMYSMDATHNFIMFVIVSYNCERATNQANKAIDIIHTFPYDADPGLKDEIVLFCLQISYMQPGKSKSTSLWLNYSYIRNCAGYVVTNLILMIQWTSDMVKDDWIFVQNVTNYVSVGTK